MSLHIESTSIAVPKDRVITLEMMKSVKLMNRTDSKYVGPAARLEPLLSAAIDRGYSVQAVGEKFIAEYGHPFMRLLPDAPQRASDKAEAAHQALQGQFTRFHRNKEQEQPRKNKEKADADSAFSPS